MKTINFDVSYMNETKSVSVTSDTILKEMIDQVAEAYGWPTNVDWIVSKQSKKGESKLLELGKDLEFNQIEEGDTIILGLPTKGGAS